MQPSVKHWWNTELASRSFTEKFRDGGGEQGSQGGVEDDKLQTLVKVSSVRFSDLPWQSGTGAFHWWMPCGVRVQVAVVWPIRLKPRSQLKRKVLPSFVPVWLCTEPFTGGSGVLQYAAKAGKKVNTTSQVKLTFVRALSGPRHLSFPFNSSSCWLEIANINADGSWGLIKKIYNIEQSNRDRPLLQRL